MKKILVIFTLALVSSNAFGLDYFLKSASLTNVTALQADKNTITGGLAWTPRLKFSEMFGARGNLGIVPYAAKDKSFQFFFDYEALFSFYFYEGWTLEAGTGAQTWFEKNETSVVATGMLTTDLSNKLFNLVHRAFLGYTYYFSKTNAAHEFLAGLGFDF